ncbi:hypothetical protein [Desulfosporosinus sp. BG]|nr:hypothetical protein [Desulfosporosinus sp. BG]
MKKNIISKSLVLALTVSLTLVLSPQGKPLQRHHQAMRRRIVRRPRLAR